MPSSSLSTQKAASVAGIRIAPGKTFSIPNDIKWMDSFQLEALTNAFRVWSKDTPRVDVRRSRARVWLVYLILRYTGCRLGEALALDDQLDISLERGVVRLGRREGEAGREIQLPDAIVAELKEHLLDPANRGLAGHFFQVDQGFIRRKLYERADEAELPRELANTRVLRKSRAIELLRSDVPLTVVQSMLGHSTSNLAAGYMDYSDEDIRRILGQFIQKESKRRTSARNAFYGKITGIKSGDLQSLVEVTTLSGLLVRSVITNDSLETLALSKDQMATATIKAPWVVVSTDAATPRLSSSNKFQGQVVKVTKGRIAAEVIVALADATRICAIVTEESIHGLDLQVGNQAWVIFSAYSVILSLE